MKSTGLSKSRLIAIVHQIRQLSEFTTEERRLAVDAILKELGILQVDNEALLCGKCASVARGYATTKRGDVDHASLWRLGSKGKLKVYRVCCKNFYSKAEITSLPPKRKEKSEVSVGMHYQSSYKKKQRGVTKYIP